MAENSGPAAAPADRSSPSLSPTPPLPRVTIRFCTQCKWMLRAAYYAQELLSTFSTSLGEVALQPATGGVFVVEIITRQERQSQSNVVNVLWDRKSDGGFPETKELKRRVRDVIQPGRDLGHVDRDYNVKTNDAPAVAAGVDSAAEKKEAPKECEDCK
ncbi:Rdx family-domain-containing protein [Apodospora peruviana]|uniref:Rdx family-domain-containing protein n=1 Tax=Apodospora peruviana TaxID=516989 RepID=A0AAE0IC72_9PEZI|nr:Rdx family-domain-containing protein [Apodospora peruviana]